ncbi:MAG: response regulator [Clostridiales bacterium]|nr:response regulator [Clostridiales bacterium]
MGAKNNLSTKIILMVEGIILISSILFCTVSIYRARVGIRKAIQQRMLDIANCASGSVNGDVLGGLDEDKVGSAEYNNVYDTLAVFRDNVELEYVYCIKEASPGNFIFTMDLDQYTPASYGDSVEYTDALARAGRGEAAVDEVPYTDQWGEFYSAYSPVKDSHGNVAGIVAVDFSVEWFEGQLSAQTKSTIISYVIILIFSLLVAALLALFTVSPFVKMQGELMEEKIRAESANHAKSDFLANMSHEIRTPINAVLGMNEMIMREGRKAQDLTKSSTQDIRETLRNIVVYAGDVENAGHNLLAIVNDILDFSKIEEGRMDLVEAPYKLGSLLNNISNMVLYKAQDKKLDFIIDVDENLPDELQGDEVRVRQILTNILNNAVKYTEKGSVKLTIRGEKMTDEYLILHATVEDTGIGIREEDKEKLFERFQRLEMERNSTVEGTGLGLVITQRLLEMMHGTIDVESEYGKGSVFTVTIPQKILSAVPVGNFQERFEVNLLEARAYRESFRAPDARILIVDDTRINLNVVVNLLKDTRMQIDTSTSGANAVAMAEKTRYDVILMDQRMPEMDGTEALHKIRSTESGASKDAPIVCLTADAVVGAKEHYLAEGFSDYLTKPIDSFALEKLLIRYLPQEKVESVREETGGSTSMSDAEESDSEKADAAEDGFATLRAAGIDPDIGLLYCQKDENFYRSLLAEYASENAEKTESIRTSFAGENWHDYAIYVHALKSTSKMIGASTLSEMAAGLEAAANAGDAATIKRGHDVMMAEYEAVAGAIRSVVPERGTSSIEDDIMEFTPGEDDVIEFLPHE